MINRYDVPLQLNNENPITAILSYISSGIEILEMGSASGRLTRYLSEEMGCRVSIVEIDPPSFENTMQFAADGICANLDKNDWYDYYSGRKFDAIIFADVIEHLNQPIEVIKKAKSLLKDDGKILFSIPNISYNGIVAQLLNNNFKYTETGILDSTHVKFYTYFSFHQLMESCGMYIFSEKAIRQDINIGDWPDFERLGTEEKKLLCNREFSDVFEYVFASVTNEWYQQHGDELVNERITNFKGTTAVSTLYFDYGDGFKSQNYLQTNMLINMEGDFSVVFNLSEIKNIKHLRFDPCDYECKIKLLSVNGILANSISAMNDYVIKDETVYFYTKDPNFLITDVEAIPGLLLEIKGVINQLTNSELIGIIQEQKTALSEKIFLEHEEVEKITLLYRQCCKDLNYLNESLNALNTEANSLNEALVVKTAEANSLNEALITMTAEVTSLNEALIAKTVEAHDTELQLIEVQKQLKNLSLDFEQRFIACNNISNSTCWKLTKPLRIVLDATKTFCSKVKTGKGIEPLKKTYHYFRLYGFKKTAAKIAEKLLMKVSSKKQMQGYIYNTCGRIEIKPISVSVVIPTYNAGQELRALLENLLHQESVGFMEIIIVDSGSTDDTVNIAQSYDAIVLSISQEQFSHSYSRNLGASHANGENILFMTQDALPSSTHWLMEMYTPMHNDNSIVAVSCGETPRPDADLFGLACSWGHARFMGVLECDRIMGMPRINSMEEIRRNANLNDVACLVKKRIFEAFEYRFNYAEDLDLGIRLIKNGHRLALLGTVKVIHSHTRPEFYYLKRAFVERKALHDIFPDEPLANINESDFLLGTKWLYNHTRNTVRYLSALPNELDVDEYVIRVNEIFNKADEDISSEITMLYEPTVEFTDFIQIIETKCKALKTCNPSERGRAAFAMYFKGQSGMILDYLKNHIENVTVQTNQLMCKALYCVCANAIGDVLGYTWLTGYRNNYLLTELYEKVGKGV